MGSDRRFKYGGFWDGRSHSLVSNSKFREWSTALLARLGLKPKANN